MAQILITHIKGLAQAYDQAPAVKRGKDLMHLPVIENAWLHIADGLVAGFGTMDTCPHVPEAQQINAVGRWVFPSFVDSHTHLVFAASREGEFVDRINGLSYEEIAQKGGGILNSARRLAETDEDQLFDSALRRLHEIIGFGTGAVEIKSGYGLSLEAELKMLRVVKRLKAVSPIAIKATFLGAHAIPKTYTNRRDYIDLVVKQMLPHVAEQELADYCDVFCDKGFFSPQETEEILQAGLALGLKPRIHANELAVSGGVQVGVKNGALSVDHLECIGDDEIACLLEGNTMPTLLPSTAFFLGIPYPPARKLIDAGLPVSLASDYNPGSSPSGNMQFVLSLACIQLKMRPEEAINAATVNAAHTLEMGATHGYLRMGQAANLFITSPMQSPAFLPYAFGSNKVETIILNGKIIQKP